MKKIIAGYFVFDKDKKTQKKWVPQQLVEMSEQEEQEILAYWEMSEHESAMQPKLTADEKINIIIEKGIEDAKIYFDEVQSNRALEESVYESLKTKYENSVAARNESLRK